MMADDDTAVVGDTPEQSDESARGDANNRGIGNNSPSPRPVGLPDRSPSVQEGEGASIESLKQRVETLEDSLLRAKADYQNLQRRNMSERAEAILYANADLMKSLLPVVEGLQRAIESAKSSDNLKSVFEGVRLVYEDLMKSLGGHGLETIDAKGKKFDPHVHEALMMQPTKDVADGTVIEEVGRGYQLRDRVLRPAKVIVAKAEQ